MDARNDGMKGVGEGRERMEKRERGEGGARGLRVGTGMNRLWSCVGAACCTCVRIEVIS
jgi:hypothetical protein